MADPEYIIEADRKFGLLKAYEFTLKALLLEEFPDHEDAVGDYWNTLVTECWDM
jgi:hypothetical protein